MSGVTAPSSSLDRFTGRDLVIDFPSLDPFVEEDRQQEKYQGVSQSSLGAEAELEAVDGRPGGVEVRTGEDGLTLLAPLHALVDVGVVGPLGVVLDCQQRVEEDVEESEADGGTEPRYEDDQPALQPETSSIQPSPNCWFSNLLDNEFEFSRSLSSIIIWPEDIEDSSCLARHCSVFRMSRRWQPYSFFRTSGSDSARFTLQLGILSVRRKIYFSIFISC